MTTIKFKECMLNEAQTKKVKGGRIEYRWHNGREEYRHVYGEVATEWRPRFP